MESVQTISAPVGVQQTVVARPAPAPVVQAIQTDLSPTQAVTATTTSGETDNNTLSNPSDYQNVVTIDPATREIVSREIDSLTGQIIQQIPAQALLRMRAYTRALANGKTVTEALALTDLEA
jgi:hypothetical protein